MRKGQKIKKEAGIGPFFKKLKPDVEWDEIEVSNLFITNLTWPDLTEPLLLFNPIWIQNLH